jgi:ribose 5-phosphate isomerase B
MGMSANRHRGIRCALVNEPVSARLSRQHNNSNVIALGARLTGADMAQECVLTWLTTSYEGGRHQQRIDKLENL